jgi:hypothetical protein
VKRTKQEWGFICLGLAVGFLLGEVKQLMQPQSAPVWSSVFAVLTLACLMLGFYLTGQDRTK